MPLVAPLIAVLTGIAVLPGIRKGVYQDYYRIFQVYISSEGSEGSNAREGAALFPLSAVNPIVTISPRTQDSRIWD